MMNNEDNKDDIMVGFTELEFNPEENNVEDHDIMSSKQFNILNSKLNFNLQFLKDSSGKLTVSG